MFNDSYEWYHLKLNFHDLNKWCVLDMDDYWQQSYVLAQGNFDVQLCTFTCSLCSRAVAVVGQHSRVTVHCYPLTSQILQCCPLRDF